MGVAPCADFYLIVAAICKRLLGYLLELFLGDVHADYLEKNSEDLRPCRAFETHKVFQISNEDARQRVVFELVKPLDFNSPLPPSSPSLYFLATSLWVSSSVLLNGLPDFAARSFARSKRLAATAWRPARSTSLTSYRYLSPCALDFPDFTSSIAKISRTP